MHGHGLQAEVIKTALKNMADEGRFDICTIDQILKITGGIPPAREYQMLRLLHCIKFRDMTPRLRLELPRLVQVVIESQPITFEISISPEPNNRLLPP